MKELEDMPSARQKRILANRQSAARSKERKLAYISELEAQVSSLTVQLTTASLQLRSLQQDTTSLGECNAALAQQALVLREHMAQRDAETASLAAELRRAQGVIAAHNLQDGAPTTGATNGTGSGSDGGATAVQPPPSATPQPTESSPGGIDMVSGDVQQAIAPVQPMGRLRQWTHAQAQQQGQLNPQQAASSEGQPQPSLTAAPLEQQPHSSPLPSLQANLGSDIMKQLQRQGSAQPGGGDTVSRQLPSVPDSASVEANPDMEQLVARARPAGKTQPLVTDSVGNGSGSSTFGGGSSSFTGYKGGNV